MNNCKPILVTGSHRSGTTWAGKMISAAPNVGYIYEPFNPNTRMGVNPAIFTQWFYYVSEENSGAYDDVLNSIVKFRYPFVNNALKIRTVRDIAKLLRDQGLSLLNQLTHRRPLLKDPIAFFSAEWLYRRFDMDVLILIRHPAAFFSSLKILGWQFDFNNILHQPLLMENVLYPFADDIENCAKLKNDPIDQAILLWKCIHYCVLKYKRLYPDWLFIRHEDLSLDPLNQFRSIYDKFNLEFTDNVEKQIRESSGPHNPVEQVTGMEFMRNSKANIWNWKNRLSDEEITRIKEKTSTIATEFYSESEW